MGAPTKNLSSLTNFACYGMGGAGGGGLGWVNLKNGKFMTKIFFSDNVDLNEVLKMFEKW